MIKVINKQVNEWITCVDNTYYTNMIRLYIVVGLTETKDSLIRKVSLLKRNLLAAPFERAFLEQGQYEDQEQANPSSELMSVNYRSEEAIYVKSSFDRVTVIFSTKFKDETDKIFGKVFLQEFVDARRRPALQNAPQVLYTTREPPMELRNVVQDTPDTSYVTFGRCTIKQFM